MEQRIDTLPWKTFKKLKEKYSVKTILLTGNEITGQGLHLAYKDHREFITAMFKREGVEVYRFNHNYKSLDTSHPELGLVFMANDSAIVPGVEVHALIGHNARYISEVKNG
jgi:hypothetical protein